MFARAALVAASRIAPRVAAASASVAAPASVRAVLPAAAAACVPARFMASGAAPAAVAASQVAVQQLAPHFSGKAVVDGQFVNIKLSDYQGKWLVLFFYPLDFTFVCPTEIIAFSDRVQEFRNLGAEVVGVSVDSHFSHLAWINTPRKEGGLGKMNIPLLADITKSISASYGVLLPTEGIALRGLFIIDPKSKVRQITVNDLPVGRSVDETLRLLQAFQFTDKHGEVCPAGWTPGSNTIKPDVKASKEFFNKAA